MRKEYKSIRDYMAHRLTDGIPKTIDTSCLPLDKRKAGLKASGSWIRCGKKDWEILGNLTRECNFWDFVMFLITFLESGLRDSKKLLLIVMFGAWLRYCESATISSCFTL